MLLMMPGMTALEIDQAPLRRHGKPREKRENWLLIKGEDDFA